MNDGPKNRQYGKVHQLYSQEQRGKPQWPMPEFPDYVWCFIVAIICVFGAWNIWSWLPLAQLLPLTILALTLGTVFFFMGIWKSTMPTFFKFWAGTAYICGVLLAYSYYSHTGTPADIALVVGIVGGFLGLMALLT